MGVAAGLLKKRAQQAGLIEEVLAPLIVRVPHEAHDMAAGVEIEGAGFAREVHSSFVRILITFLPIAGVTAGDKILPGRRPATRTRHNVVESQLSRSQNVAAVLAGIAVAQQYVFSRQRPRLVRDAPVFQEANDGGNPECESRRMKVMAILLLGHGDSFQNQHNGTTRCADVNGLVGSVQNQDWSVQGMAVTLDHRLDQRRHVAVGAPCQIHRIVRFT